MSSINFHTASPLAFELSLTKEDNYRQWLQQVIEKEGYSLNELNYVFCTDDYLHEMNLRYLKHDTLTDVITFNNSDDACCIEGDIFISIHRIEDNAEKFGVQFLEELKRVMVHGLLHLLGYADYTEEEKLEMRGKEDFYLGRGEQY